MNCSTCRHWDRNGTVHETADPNSEKCEFIEAPHRKCLRIVHQALSDPPPKDDDAFVISRESSGGALWTPPSFSCPFYSPTETT